MKKFTLKKRQETLAIVMAGTMLFTMPQPYLIEEPFELQSLYIEEEYSRKLARKKKTSSGKYVGYTRQPRNGFGRPNSSLPIRNEE